MVEARSLGSRAGSAMTISKSFARSHHNKVLRGAFAAAAINFSIWGRERIRPRVLLARTVGGGLHGRGHRVRATAGGLFDAEIVPAEIGPVVARPDTGVIECQNAGGGHGEHRAFHLTLLIVEILRQARACIVDIEDAARA